MSDGRDMPLTWRCVRCQREFDLLPDAPGPYAFEIKTDATGWQTAGGNICWDCYHGSRP